MLTNTQLTLPQKLSFVEANDISCQPQMPVMRDFIIGERPRRKGSTLLIPTSRWKFEIDAHA